MLSYPRAVRAYAAVNVAGQLNHRLCTRDGWAEPLRLGLSHHLDRYGRGYGAEPGMPPQAPCLTAALDRARLSGAYAMAEFPRLMRHAWGPLAGVVEEARMPLMGSATPRPAAFAAYLASYPLLEALVGRGHLLNLRPSDLAERLPGDGHARLDRHLHFGVAGYLLEWPCIVLAQVHARGRRPDLAAACLWAATVGRVLLQPIRLIACAACLVVTGPVALALALVVATRDALCAVLQALGLPMVSCSSPHEPDAPLGLFDAIARRVLHERVLEGTLPANNIRATPKNDVSGQVRAFMSLRLQDFAHVPDGSESEVVGAVQTIRDSIVERLHDYCLDLPDAQGYRWGISQLNSYLVTSHDEALCVSDAPEAPKNAPMPAGPWHEESPKAPCVPCASTAAAV